MLRVADVTSSNLLPFDTFTYRNPRAPAVYAERQGFARADSLRVCVFPSFVPRFRIAPASGSSRSGPAWNSLRGDAPSPRPDRHRQLVFRRFRPPFEAKTDVASCR